MESDARLFFCVACRTPRVICRRCDRGQRYCSRSCAQAARRRSLGAAGARYQRSLRGRFSHAARQRRYRERGQKVTHQGSPPAAVALSSPPPDCVRGRPSAPATAVQLQTTAAVLAAVLVCDFCGSRCSPWLRRSWVRSGAEIRSRHRRARRPSG
jgi:hypothetical protein